MAKLSELKRMEELLERLEEGRNIKKDKTHQMFNDCLIDSVEIGIILSPLHKEISCLRRWIQESTIDPEVGLYCNWILHTDVEPFEIISITPSGKTLTIRSMDATIDPDFNPCTQIGGFAGHTLNNYGQSYSYKSNLEGEVRKVSKTKRGWKRGSLRYRISESPSKFYDYNF